MGATTSELRYSTNDLARQCGCGRKTIRRLQALGLIAKPARSRRPSYDDDTVARVRVILALRAAGFSLRRIETLLGVGEKALDPAQAAAPLAKALAEATRSVEQRLAELGRVRDELAAARDTMLKCNHCDPPGGVCQRCIDKGLFDPLARALLTPGREPPATER